jgi:hypothetical protein
MSPNLLAEKETGQKMVTSTGLHKRGLASNPSLEFALFVFEVNDSDGWTVPPLPPSGIPQMGGVIAPS